jgi:hypothetical protein
LTKALTDALRPQFIEMRAALRNAIPLDYQKHSQRNPEWLKEKIVKGENGFFAFR